MNGGFSGRKLHLIGIGGAGMSGLALAAHELGALVTGSDREQSSYTERLAEAGIDVSFGHDAANVPEGADVVVSTAILESNPELAAARERGLNVLHRSELLAELVETRGLSIAVAGTHGKTTTTAMIAHVLDVLGEDPSYFVGGEVTIGPRTTNAHLGSSEVVVIEADESDGSFKRYTPDISVITNIEFEHPETWSGLDELIAAFAAFAANSAQLVLPAVHPRIDEVDPQARALTFGIEPERAQLTASRVETPADPALGTSFELTGSRVSLGVRGRHNVSNALAALAALQLAGIELARSIPALASFGGVARRFELIGRHASGAAIYDDYAHHPTEVRVALTAAREASGGGRVIVVFMPHLYSRTRAYTREFAEALSLADAIVVMDIYPARERAEDFPGVTGWLQATRVADVARGRPVYYEPRFEDAQVVVDRILRPGDLCIGLGAGNIHKFTRGLIEGADA